MTIPTIGQLESKIRPAKSVPVQSRNCPKMLGPKYPPRVPMELIAAIPAAAPAPLRKAVGNVQKTGAKDQNPQPAMQRTAILIIGLAVMEANANPKNMAM